MSQNTNSYRLNGSYNLNDNLLSKIKELFTDSNPDIYVYGAVLICNAPIELKISKYSKICSIPYNGYLHKIDLSIYSDNIHLPIDQLIITSIIDTDEVIINGSFYYLAGANIKLKPDEEIIPFPPPLVPSILYYFTGSIDGDVENLNNYSPVGIPNANDNVIVNNDTVNMPDTGTLTCSTLTVNDPNYLGFTIIHNNIIAENIFFNGNSVNGGTVTTATFNDNSVNGSDVTTATFNDNSFNSGTVTTATFNDNSVNGSDVTTATFNDYSYNGGTVPTATFNDNSVNVSDVTTATFNDYSYNVGTVPTATFNDNSVNDNSVNGSDVTTATFNDYSYNGGTVPTATFNDNSFNSGIVTTATFNDYSYNGGTVTTATYIPLSIGIGLWLYPTNIGTINTADIYWLQIDNELGGTVETANYLGYP